MKKFFLVLLFTGILGPFGEWSLQAADKACTFGLPTDTPIIGDWNGDGRDEIGVKRGDKWYLDMDGDCKWTPEPPPQPVPIPPDHTYIPYTALGQVIKFTLTPNGIARFYFDIPKKTRDPLLVKIEDYCDGAMVHQTDMLVRYSGPTCNGAHALTVKDIDDTWAFCRQYAAADGCRPKWFNGKWNVPLRPGGWYYDLMSIGFETIQVAGDVDGDNPIGCYFVIVHNDDTVNTCPGISLQDF